MWPDAVIGVHAHAEPHRLRATLKSLARHSPEAEVVLLPDAPDEATAAAVAQLGSDYRVIAAEGPPGPPARFNQLAAATTHRTVVLLESGALPGPGWLRRLQAALARRGAGAAGPSTNFAWTAQAAFPHAVEARVEATAAQAAARFAERTLDAGPLVALADFCLAFRRELIEAIGGADEGYGLGPCWELEYLARAHVAGFASLWACSAFVWRAPFTERRRREEDARFEASRRRYQDSVCALRLRGTAEGYQTHCRGLDCEHFAPPALIRRRRALPKVEDVPSARPARERAGATPAQPLVSCIMPTAGRADFVLRSIEYFRRQDYPRRELLIVDDGEDHLADRLPADAAIRYVRAPRGESIGAKRNRACRAARGRFIAHWDDDDWYAPTRLTRQLEPLLAGRADATGLYAHLFFDLRAWRFWSPRPALHHRLFVNDVHNGTLVFRREVWDSLARYPAISLAEDLAFIRQAVARGARLERVDDKGLLVYVRHGANAWRLAAGSTLEPDGWDEVAEPELPPEDRAFYRERSGAARDRPLVTCLMPTADRRAFVPRAIECFLAQDYAASELLILDDGDDRVADIVPDHPRIRYVPLPERLIIGTKRNQGCEMARGEIIVHWDDDDWHAPHRISYQVGQLLASGAELCGPRRMVWMHSDGERAWLYEYPEADGRWVAGNALCYRRSFWQRHPFPELAVGEDTRFVYDAPVLPFILEDHSFLVGTVHDSNTSPKRTDGACWSPVPAGVANDAMRARAVPVSRPRTRAGR